MSQCLPVRFSRRNSAAAVSASPVGLLLFATRTDRPDVAPVLLRGEIGEIDFHNARRHALAVLDALIRREPKGQFGVELQTVDGIPVFCCSTLEGAA